MKYTVRMSQDSFFDMEVEAEDAQEAMFRALKHASEGERVAKDDDREWDTFVALSAHRK